MQRRQIRTWLQLGSLSALTLLLMGLAAWQLQRHDWKQGLIKQMQQSYQQPPLTTLPKEPTSDDQFRAVQLRGTFVPGTVFRLLGKMHRGQLGYHLIVPFKTGPHTLLVDRGWVPEKSPPPQLPKRKVTLQGFLRPGMTPTMWTPENNIPQGELFYIDVNQLQVTATRPYYPLYVVEIADAPTPDTFPVAMVEQPWHALSNNHVTYALTWLSLAALALFATLRLGNRLRNKNA